MPTIYPPDLVRLLKAVTSSYPPRDEVRRLVALCRRMALIYLRQKRQVGHLSLHQIGLSLEDLALDSISTLFRRNEAGQFPKLQRYLERDDVQERDAGLLFSALRRLVFSEVNDHLMAVYQESDPSLKKAVRNVKRAVLRTPDLYLQTHRGQTWVMLDGVERSSVGVLPPEYLQGYLIEVLRMPINLDVVLGHVVEVLTASDVIPGYPLRQLAEIIRSATVRLHLNLDTDSSDATWTAEERRGFIDRSVSAIRASLFPTYVETGKIQADMFECYVQAGHAWLVARYIGPQPLSHYEALVQHLPALTNPAYRQDHRKVFEYILKRCREHLVAALKKELQISAKPSKRKGQSP